MNVRKFDLNLLVTFNTIYSTRNISKTAKLLDVSQPSVSNALARLRAQLDDRLFVRSGNSMVPTPKADEIIASVQEALKLVENTIDPEQGFDPSTSEKKFRLIISDTTEILIIPKLLRALEATSIQLEFIPPQRYSIEEALISDEADLALFLLPSQHAEISNDLLFSSDICVIARNAHPRIQGQITVDQLKSEHRVTIRMMPGQLKNSEKIKIWRNSQEKDKCTVNSLNSIFNLVAESDYIGFAPKIHAQAVAKRHHLQILDWPMPPMQQHYLMSWNKKYQTEAAHIWLREQIKKLTAPLALSEQTA